MKKQIKKSMTVEEKIEMTKASISTCFVELAYLNKLSFESSRGLGLQQTIVADFSDAAGKRAARGEVIMNRVEGLRKTKELLLNRQNNLYRVV